MPLVATETLSGRIWIARPNRSLPVSGAQLQFIVATGISSVIAVAFSLLGAWPVIPFTGLELTVLWWALQRCEKHATDFERITLEAGRLIVETQKGAIVERHEFHPYWALLRYDKPAGQRPQRLLIRSHGKEIEVGSLLTEDQKTALANELKKELGAQ